MHVYDHFRFLVGCFSIYLLAFICTKREYCLCIQLLKPKLCQMSPPYLPICGISMPFQVNLHVPTLIFQNNFPFCVPVPLMMRQGVANIFHARCVILTMSVYSLVIARERAVIGMPSPMLKIELYNANKLPQKVDCMEGTRAFG